jgi:putative FmdB family regulatory protein
MPTYEYVCKSCGHLFEIVQSMRDEALTECPRCGGELRKVFAPPAISFKGSGFYATDHRKKAKHAKPDQKADQRSDTAGDKKDAKGEGKADTDGKSPSTDAKPAPAGGGGPSATSAKGEG